MKVCVERRGKGEKVLCRQGRKGSIGAYLGCPAGWEGERYESLTDFLAGCFAWDSSERDCASRLLASDLLRDRSAADPSRPPLRPLTNLSEGSGESLDELIRFLQHEVPDGLPLKECEERWKQYTSRVSRVAGAPPCDFAIPGFQCFEDALQALQGITIEHNHFDRGGGEIAVFRWSSNGGKEGPSCRSIEEKRGARRMKSRDSFCLQASADAAEWESLFEFQWSCTLDLEDWPLPERRDALLEGPDLEALKVHPYGQVLGTILSISDALLKEHRDSQTQVASSSGSASSSSQGGIQSSSAGNDLNRMRRKSTRTATENFQAEAQADRETLTEDTTGGDRGLSAPADENRKGGC
uniref:Uncharacterized protein n=1 Tax=Chromera velia CCMP2878 TaxID=1169474 RepID=A0A0G4HTG1_9ALVE|eukprot:Cvel_8473.t1-p1 / transcript=Cvel_8473.t1 / gene=Cvel_8473 / organism=Chromera_velia_CCMP2878 / gene_product=hypothetical protein / transcript_product=hypothetical protein / location=Cvel_scaffold468:26191-30957(-) / protein_length=353 / sequence_SO=supercontig / SO=protein_coding / is_pseudo=false